MRVRLAALAVIASVALAGCMADAAPSKRVLVVGDSIGVNLGDSLVRNPSGMDVTNGAIGGCGLNLGVIKPFTDLDWWHQTSCPDWPAMWPQEVAAEDPDVVVMHIGFWDSFDIQLNEKYIRNGTAQGDRYFLWQMQQAYNRLTAQGATVVALPIPCFAPTIPPILGHTLAYEVWRADHVNQLLQQFAASHPTGFALLDYRPVICPDGKFTWSIKGVQIRTDDGLHLTDAGSDRVVAWLTPQIQALGG